MAVMEKSWEGIRQDGVVFVTVPRLRWTRTCYEWELGRMRAYLRAAAGMPSDVRLEIFRWLESQELQVEEELGERGQPSGLAAELFFWAAAAASMCVVIGCLVWFLGGGS
jgi:hypothetical protein